MDEVLVKRLTNRYIDSVSLMAMSTKANQIEGVKQAIIAMGTQMNKEVMQNVGLFNDQVAAAEASDLLITLRLEAEADQTEILSAIEAILDRKEKQTASAVDKIYHTIADAVEEQADANLALISVNGKFATREARQALNHNLNVMMFSDNVSIEDEIELKELATEKGLLMMGPDCGTAIIDNIGLGFANKVRQGNIGIIGASGTGSQEIAVRIHEFGGGISQLIGTGGRDLSLEVGGRMMLMAIERLAEDPDTDVIVLVSKPPADSVKEKVLSRVKALNKPVVIWFVGQLKEKQEGNVYFADMSKNAALKAVELAGVDLSNSDLHPLNLPLIQEVKRKLKPEQQYIRGLFTGGTLASEAYYIAKQTYERVYSNLTKESETQDLYHVEGHSFIDFGADEYTNGKPHPMIDPSTRLEAFKEIAGDPNVGVILLDFVIGYGAHEDPVGSMMEAIIEAKTQAAKAGRHLEIVGYVLGTDLDKQNLQGQFAKLEQAGATYASSMQNAALLATGFVGKEG